MKGFSRRAQRKQDRVEKKQKKNLFFQQKKGQPNDVTTYSNNKPKVDSSENIGVEKTKRKRKKKSSDNSKNTTRIDKKREQRLLREEERTIKKYEKLLKLKSYTKRNKLPKSFYYDGLGELLELCDNKKFANRVVVDDEKDDFAQLRNRSKKQTSNVKKQEEEDEEEEDSGEDDDFDDEEMEEDDVSDAEEVSDKDNDGQDFSDEEMEGSEDDDLDGFNEADDLEEEEKERPAKKTKKINKEVYHEDIYGFIRDKDGNVVKSDTDQRHTKLDILNSNVVVDETLQRKIRGLVNRLTADNIKVISKEILDLYKRNSRAVINNGILNCFEKVIINVDYSVPAKLVSEIAMLVAILNSEMGEEVGAFFIHTAIRHFDQIFSDPARWDATKRLNNIIILILNLYATGLVDSAIVYDILDKLCINFTNEKSIEIIDLILKASGFLLRKDDAARMKALIVHIQQLSSSVDQSGLSGTRIKFILESLTAIKNNNMAKIKMTDPVVMSELIESTLKGVIKKGRVPFIPGQYATVIQSSHWFSYTANIVPLEAINAKDNEAKDETVTKMNAFSEVKIDYQLRDQLCKKLRINTPLRKDLFTALFACNDYLDAACKLISIGKKQFSEVINVVLHVAVNEKNYNQFYYHLLHHLTTCDRKYRLALDFAVRDKIGQVETMSTAHRNTFSKLLFNLLKGNAVAITCLKVVQFSDMNEIYVDFIRKILEPLFSQCDDATVESVLMKIPKKDSFASAIKLFITCFMSADSKFKSRLSSVKQLPF